MDCDPCAPLEHPKRLGRFLSARAAIATDRCFLLHYCGNPNHVGQDARKTCFFPITSHLTSVTWGGTNHLKFTKNSPEDDHSVMTSAEDKMPSHELQQATLEAFAEQMVEMLNYGTMALMVSIGHRTSMCETMAGLPPGDG